MYSPNLFNEYAQIAYLTQRVVKCSVWLFFCALMVCLRASFPLWDTSWTAGVEGFCVIVHACVCETERERKRKKIWGLCSVCESWEGKWLN